MKDQQRGRKGIPGTELVGALAKEDGRVTGDLIYFAIHISRCHDERIIVFKFDVYGMGGIGRLIGSASVSRIGERFGEHPLSQETLSFTARGLSRFFTACIQVAQPGEQQYFFQVVRFWFPVDENRNSICNIPAGITAQKGKRLREYPAG